MNLRQPKLPKSSERYEFTKGQELIIDEIRTIQGLCKGDWWRFKNYNENGIGYDELTDHIIITRDITICITEF